MMMHWTILIIAGLFETGFAFCLGKARISEGSIAAGWYAGFGICLLISMALLIKSVQVLPVGTAYAVWTGIGAVGTVIAGVFFLNEPAGFWRLFFVFTLIASVVGLKITE